MRIEFTGKTSTPWTPVRHVNTVNFHLKNGYTVTLDRNITEGVGMDDDSFWLLWKEVYVWKVTDPDGDEYFVSDKQEPSAKLLENLKEASIEFEFDEEAGEDDGVFRTTEVSEIKWLAIA